MPPAEPPAPDCPPTLWARMPLERTPKVSSAVVVNKIRPPMPLWLPEPPTPTAPSPSPPSPPAPPALCTYRPIESAPWVVTVP
jgi:protein TonB